MDKFALFLAFLWFLFFIFLFIQLVEYIKYKNWLKEIEKKPPPKKILDILNNIKYYTLLPKNLKKVMNFKIQIFLNEKKFIGIKINITDEIKINIAFYACLLTLYAKYFCYPNVEYIFVYPSTIVKKEIEKYFANQEILIEGEATYDTVLIAWNDAKKEIKSCRGNVIVHEFAHEIDYSDGNIDGLPPLDSEKSKEFAKIMFREYEKFKEKTIKGRFLGKYHLINKYATTNKAEFFAVMSEYFFIRPALLKKHFPDIYKELKTFYKIDTYKILGENNVC
ncbi:MtfA peptidase [Lebetimonas natsushimae]|uniref:MtfA peptidase n=1 Tax=Lebetimonas natsushimae TaxID=1936991 RepID=A0A292YGE5_9BACT|nr:zinc-dependent peptidase [Lebetimonas natsushimae]GAX87985.1 MtfA peptidase [Lebetimonas natsushimae]